MQIMFIRFIVKNLRHEENSKDVVQSALLRNYG